MNHTSFCCAWMDVISLNGYTGCRSIKAFILQFTKSAAINRISKFSTESIYIKLVWSPTNFFIWCKGNAYFPMLNMFILDKVFHRSHNFSYTCFIIGTEECRTIGCDKSMAYKV